MIPLFVSVDKAKERSAICKTCDQFKAGFCMECGCLLKFKVLFAAGDCPVGKWNMERATDIMVHTIADDLSTIEESTTSWDNWKAIE